jgi:ubiquinone/menaquinone biosynthesis C-methylase UbiE
MKQEEINKNWSDSSTNYDRIIQDELQSFRVEAWQEQILSHFDEGAYLKILDLGCGPGFFSIILSAKGHDVTGIDGAEGMIQRARRNVKNNNSTAEILEMNAAKLDFPDNTFDLLVCRNVTHTLLDHAGTYTEWKRVLKTGGKLLIYDANWHFEFARPDIREQYLKDWKECIRRFGSDFNENTDPDAIPEIEEEPEGGHPLLDLVRPDFDYGVLKAIGFSEISFVRDITERLWDDKEKLLYGTTPMFEICAVK